MTNDVISINFNTHFVFLNIFRRQISNFFGTFRRKKRILPKNMEGHNRPVCNQHTFQWRWTSTMILVGKFFMLDFSRNGFFYLLLYMLTCTLLTCFIFGGYSPFVYGFLSLKWNKLIWSRYIII